MCKTIRSLTTQAVCKWHHKSESSALCELYSLVGVNCSLSSITPAMECEGACFHPLSHAKHPAWFGFSSSHLDFRKLSRNWFSTSVFCCFVMFSPDTSTLLLLLDVTCGWFRCTVIPISLAYFVASFINDWWPWSTARSS